MEETRFNPGFQKRVGGRSSDHQISGLTRGPEKKVWSDHLKTLSEEDDEEEEKRKFCGPTFRLSLGG